MMHTLMSEATALVHLDETRQRLLSQQDEVSVDVPPMVAVRHLHGTHVAPPPKLTLKSLETRPLEETGPGRRNALPQVRETVTCTVPLGESQKRHMQILCARPLDESHQLSTTTHADTSGAHGARPHAGARLDTTKTTRPVNQALKRDTVTQRLTTGTHTPGRDTSGHLPQPVPPLTTIAQAYLRVIKRWGWGYRAHGHHGRRGGRGRRRVRGRKNGGIVGDPPAPPSGSAGPRPLARPLPR